MIKTIMLMTKEKCKYINEYKKIIILNNNNIKKLNF